MVQEIIEVGLFEPAAKLLAPILVWYHGFIGRSLGDDVLLFVGEYL